MSIRVEQFWAELTDLTPTSNNPRQINKKDFEKLKKSLKEFPEMKEIREVVIDENNRILGGHMRVRALKELGEKTIFVKQVFGLTEEQKDEFVIKDNIANGEWDMDELANSWSELPLDEWGLGIALLPVDEIIEAASLGTIKEYDESDGIYDLTNLIRETVSPDITDSIQRGVEAGRIRPEIASILKKRAEQCTVFNFDEIIRFYRSGEASEDEKELLERLYLVFLTPKEILEKQIAELDRVTGEIYDDSLLVKEQEGQLDDE